MRGNVTAIVLVAFGVFFLLNNLGLLHISLWEVLQTWWPLIPITLGVALFLTPEPKIKSKAQQDLSLPK